MPIDYTVLKSELTTDSTGLGLTALYNAGGDNQCVALLNAVRAGISISVATLRPHDVFAALVPSEWAAVSADNKSIIQIILSLDAINPNDPNTKAAFLQAFGAGTTTRANLTALLTRQGSRAEKLFGVGVTLSDADIAKARAS